MGVIDIPRDEAEALGLLTPETTLSPEPPPFPEMTAARLPALDQMPELQASILKVFGANASFKDGTLSLAPERAMPMTGAAGEMKLGALYDKTVTPPPAYVNPREARNLIASGQAIAKAPGKPAVRIDTTVEQHWKDKGYTPATIDARLRHTRDALAALQEPQEVWERRDGTWYLREFHSPPSTKKRRILVQVDKDNKVITWIPTSSSPRYFNKKREGTLHSMEGA